MSGLLLKGGGGLSLGTTVTAAPASLAPAVAAYGPSGTTVVSSSPGIKGNSSGQAAVYFGFICLAGLVVIRQSLPK